ncbi:MAG: metallophosphoesterase [Planctomycetes bacterium]|nr:metallophosphoesterase [Planctomycetota bacterium]
MQMDGPKFPMRIIITADLHYDVARSREPAKAIAREICERGGDILLIVGDTASANLNFLDEAFGLFESFGGSKLTVAGNHELWTAGAACSLHRHENELAEACSRNGIHYLEREPFIADGIAFVGSVGWYDYSFRPR